MDQLLIRILVGTVVNTYDPETYEFLAEAAKIGFLPESYKGRNTKLGGGVSENIVNRYTTQYIRDYEPSECIKQEFEKVKELLEG